MRWLGFGIFAFMIYCVIFFYVILTDISDVGWSINTSSDSSPFNSTDTDFSPESSSVIHSKIQYFISFLLLNVRLHTHYRKCIYREINLLYVNHYRCIVEVMRNIYIHNKRKISSAPQRYIHVSIKCVVKNNK